MNYNNKLSELITQKNGVVITSDLTNANIPRQFLSEFIKKGLLEKIDRGAYLSPDAFDDEMYRLQVRFKPIVFSHETALFFNGLTDRDPLQYSVTVYSGYQTTKLKELGVNTFSIKKELFETGLSTGTTAFGRSVRMYDAERALCDCLRNRNKTDIAILTDALKRYTRKKERNIPKLMRYAEVLKVSNILRGYLEVLL